jgi:integrase
MIGIVDPGQRLELLLDDSDGLVVGSGCQRNVGAQVQRPRAKQRIAQLGCDRLRLSCSRGRLLRPADRAGHQRLRMDVGGITDATPYTLRHSGISWALSAGIPAGDVARFAGTSIRMLEQVYHHLIASSVGTARARMNTLQPVAGQVLTGD